MDRSTGVWRRMIVAPFETVIPIERQDPGLAKRLIESELPGAFNWALEGLLRLWKRGYFVEPDSCRKLKDEHRLTCLSEEAFLREHVAAGKADVFIYVEDLYAAYRTYMAASGGHPIAMKRFSPAVQPALSQRP
ncbi:MAG: hypothetical protein M5U26_10370 [Planctomycetota bacterium]|nr:hypothetical protein [Planctomycetota bacterium]